MTRLALALLLALPAQAQTVILYAHTDLAEAQRIHALARIWDSVWWDRDLKPGQPWRTTIARKVCTARTVVVVWSSYSAESPEVGAEWRHALACGRKVVPVLLDRVPIPAELGARQAVDWR